MERVQYLQVVRWSPQKLCAWVVRGVFAPVLWYSTAVLPA